MIKAGLLFVMKPTILVGGQAVIEGVMMRVPGAYATAVRDPEGKIHIDRKIFKSLGEKSWFWKMPIIRGLAGLYESMKMGMETLQWSADIAIPDEKDKPKNKFADFFSSLLAISLAITLFMIAPMWLTTKAMDIEKEAFIFMVLLEVVKHTLYYLF